MHWWSQKLPTNALTRKNVVRKHNFPLFVDLKQYWVTYKSWLFSKLKNFKNKINLIPIKLPLRYLLSRISGLANWYHHKYLPKIFSSTGNIFIKAMYLGSRTPWNSDPTYSTSRLLFEKILIESSFHSSLSTPIIRAALLALQAVLLNLSSSLKQKSGNPQI
jgi:hypothetical protein